MPKLYVSSLGAPEGTVFHLLEKQISVGRGEDNMVRIGDSTVSKYHAVFLWDTDGYKLQDLDSTNGTRVNGQPITETKLNNGDSISFGEIETRYEAPVVNARPALTTAAPRLRLDQAAGGGTPAPVAPKLPVAIRNPCKNHPQVQAVDRCAGCAESFCSDCLVEMHGQKYCGGCKVMAVKGKPVVEEATEPCEEASTALKYAIIGIFCFGIVLEPMALLKALSARKAIAENPRLTGSGKATAALIISIIALILWVVGLYAKFKGI